MSAIEKRVKFLRKLEKILILIAGFGATKVLDDLNTGKWNTVTNIAQAIMIVGAIPFVIIGVYLHFTTPKSEKDIRYRLQSKGAPITFGIGSWIICLSIGLTWEIGFLFQLQYGPWILLSFFLGVVGGFWISRSVFGTEANLTVVLYIAASMAIPFSVLGLRNPELLATAFPMQFDAQLSQRVSILLFAADQVFVGAGAVLMAGNAWRNLQLTRAHVSKHDFRRMNDELALVIAANHELDGIIEPLSDVQSVVELYQRAETRAVFGWGWGIVERLLRSFGVEQQKVVQALGLADKIQPIQYIRNKTAHALYVPTLRDALQLLILISDSMKALQRIDDRWVTELRSNKRSRSKI